MPRRKKQTNQHYPIGLTKITVRGKKRFRYRTPQQKDFFFPIGTLELNAVEAATVFNSKYRNQSIDALLSNSPKKSLLQDWLPLVVDRVKNEELVANKISQDVFNTFLLDVERLKSSHGITNTNVISIETVNQFLTAHHKKASNAVYNAKLSFLKKVFDYLMDEGVITSNFAKLKKLKPKEEKIKKRLSIESYRKLINNAEHYLKIAIRLSFQSTHAVNEISKLKYSDCIWFDEPEFDDNTGLLSYGEMYIHREKVKKSEASRVVIPITEKIKQIIEDSKTDCVESPYIVHKLKERRKTKLAKGMTHHTQVRKADISEGFSTLRDELGLYNELTKQQRPTFHEIRSLAIFLYDQSGIDPQKRAAHSDPKTTKKYKAGHLKWTKVEAAQLEE